MNQQERIGIGELWMAVGQMYGKEINRMALGLLLDAVDDLPANDVAKALKEWVAKSTQQRHPSPAEIREKVRPTPQDKDIAVNTTMRVVEAVKKFGWPNPEDARKFVGEAAWKVVCSFGGWMYICENLGASISLTTFIAQCRDALTAEIGLKKAGVDTTLPALEQPNAGFSNRLGDVMKTFDTNRLIDIRQKE